MSVNTGEGASDSDCDGDITTDDTLKMEPIKETQVYLVSYGCLFCTPRVPLRNRDSPAEVVYSYGIMGKT